MKKLMNSMNLNRTFGAALFMAATLIPGWAHAYGPAMPVIEEEAASESTLVLEDGTLTNLPKCPVCVVRIDGSVEQCGIKGMVVCLKTLYE